jgi:hypothetical protein
MMIFAFNVPVMAFTEVKLVGYGVSFRENYKVYTYDYAWITYQSSIVFFLTKTWGYRNITNIDYMHWSE